MPDHSRRGFRSPFRSVRARTTVVAIVAVAIALCFAAFGLIGLLRGRLIDGIDQTASNRAIDVAALVQAGTVPEHFELPGEGESVVEVFGPDGAPVATTDNDLVGLPTLRLDDEHPVLFDLVSTDHDHTVTLRVAALLVRTDQGDFTVYAAQSRDGADHTVSTILVALIIGIPVMVALVGLLTWRAAGRALAPVHEITTQVALITDRELDRRVPVPTTGDEITELAATMNSMLGRVEQAMHLQRRFTADASHELRSPLTSLRTQLDVAVLESGRVSVADAAPNLFADLDRLDRLVTDLLALARLDGKARQFEPLDLALLVQGEIDRRASEAFTAHIPGAPLLVLGAPEQLERALRNVFDNADRHARSRVTVTVRETNGHVTIEVADDGSGIRPEDRERIFDRFTRIDEARATDDGGSGLGLAITRDIIEAHGGTIVAADTLHAEDGALMVITLPSSR